MTTSITILDLDIPVIGLIGFLLGFAALLLFVYFIITFSLFRSKKSSSNWTNIVKLKQETSFKENIEYFEQEIMLSKKMGDKN
ncbi:hypothetical protein [Spiroplasma endosymbiont of Megaselia nigra]|uniref:hypothetical protein n=1 Tax=Spiroplasma endosymbiont of Megaselia nigra TaxID=2478537 RepID=UPI000F87BDA6|nr:hypothetical protein [Spiroplasma endosymbiont of Megaselia nigra]RUO86199.1 hypothetical protein D9R21_04510 [Spiroplasma endosymbiont of Megaselia nigra]